MSRLRFMLLLAIVLGMTSQLSAADEESELREQARRALAKAARHFCVHVAVEGGYAWRSSLDNSLREGEEVVNATTIWVQPPGTPAVGEAFLTAYRATGDKSHLDCAVAAARALVRGQLQSGGWDYRVEFDPSLRGAFAYRVDGGDFSPRGKRKNTSTLDDNTSQAALRLVMHVDQTLQFKDPAIHEAAIYGLNALLKAQYANGGWPQRFEGPADQQLYPSAKASYPQTWSREWPKAKYYDYCTFNDRLFDDLMIVLFEAERIYRRADCRAAALRSGDFIVAAQLPEPQPAWAQQYDHAMHPAWARKFEPPSITGGESQGVVRTLMRLYRETAEKKYLAPIPAALAWFERSRLPDGRLARFYELQTNRPLYFVKDTYELTYEDDNLPTHYGFQVSDSSDSLRRDYERLAKLSPAQLAAERSETLAPQAGTPRPTEKQMAKVKAVIAALDDQGRWVEQGELKSGDGKKTVKMPVVNSDTFIKNVRTLAEFLGDR